MDHDQAIQTYASMRYVLGELTPAECDSFEDHYADCSVCMNDVELATVFAANAKEVFHAGLLAGDGRKGSRWLQWRPFPALALSGALNLILVAGLGFGLLRFHSPASVNSVETAGVESVDVVPDAIPVHGTTRGSKGAGEVVHASGKLVVLKFDLPQRYDRYYYSIDRAGNPVLSGELKVAGQPESVNLRIPLAHLPPGGYQVTVTGVIGAEREDLVDCQLEVEQR
jgi:hypothetical protein